MPSKEQYWRNPEKNRAATRKYALDNPEWKKKSNREWMRKKRGSDPEVRQKGREYSRQYRKENKESCQSSTARWVKSHPNYYMLNNAKRRSKEKNVPFDIVLADIVVPEVCPVLGIPFGQYKGMGSGGFKDDSPTLDRIVPAKGYVKGNICVISFRANTLKRDATVEELEKVIAYMRAHGGS